MDRNARIDAMLDRQDIYDCLVRFCRGMDRFDRDSFMSAFHADAEIAAGPFVGGPEELWNWAQPMHEAGQITTHHTMSNFTCDIDGDTAHVEAYYTFVGRNRDDSIWIAGGRYIDRVERRDGAWRIALRTNAIEWSIFPPAMPLPFGDVPDLYGNGAPARDKSDPAYSRPLVNKRARNIP